MNIGYARVSKAGDAQNLDLQYDALTADGVAKEFIYEDRASGKKDSRPGLDACLKALREGDTLVVWKLDRLGRDLHHLVSVVQELTERGVGLRVLAGQGAQIDTATPAGRLVFGIFAALAEFERELIRERTVAGLEAARARGRRGGRKFALTKAQVRLAQAAMQEPRHLGCRTCPGTPRQTRYPLPLRRAERRVTRERKARPQRLGQDNCGPAAKNPDLEACGSPAFIMDWHPAWGVGFRRWFWG